MTSGIEKRKLEHIDICVNKHVEARDRQSGFEQVEFLHWALPELDMAAIDTSVQFLGKRLAAPFMITAITGGCEPAGQINKLLAQAAEVEGVALGFGSQRPALEKPELIKTYQVRDVAPNAFIAGNICAIQLKRHPIEKVEELVQGCGLDALCVHLNPLHEAIQREGDTDWSGCLAAIANAADKLSVPIIAKEVGTGINGEVAKELEKAGVAAIDVAGVGGTSWAGVETFRKGLEMGHTFWDWGIPTAEAVRECAKKVKIPLIASGGVRSGLDVAKAIRLGATLGGGALPFIRALVKESRVVQALLSTGEVEHLPEIKVTEDAEAVRRQVQKWKAELRATMLLTRSKNLEMLKKARLRE